jgi:cation diffusion facilitator family transporter
MGSHALALGINAFAYWYARRNADNPAFSFGTGKVNALGGFTGALLLGVFSTGMAFESIDRLINPTNIAFDLAIAVAVIGLVVNGISVFLLGDHDHGHSHGHGHGHGDADRHHHHHHHHHYHQQGTHAPDQHDYNLRSAYFHVLADALTSVLAIVALLAGKHWGTHWMDPMIGIVGAILVARWAVTLLQDTSNTLLDKQAPPAIVEQLRNALSQGEDDVVDLHAWSVGPGLLALEATVLTSKDYSTAQIKARISPDVGVIHATIEVHPK